MPQPCLDEVKVSSNPIWEKAQRRLLLHGSISNSLTGTHTNTRAHTRRIQNEAAAPNNLPDRLSDTKTGGQKRKRQLLCEARASNYSDAPVYGHLSLAHGDYHIRSGGCEADSSAADWPCNVV